MKLFILQCQPVVKKVEKNHSYAFWIILATYK